jgi:hypothetical protein
MDFWSVPQVTDYKWYNLEKIGPWGDEDWPSAIRYYDRYGYVERKRTIGKLNEKSKFNISNIAEEEFELTNFRD